jgi:L-erythro-3,5-diaminohexanoate dehydrogenase
MRELTSVAIDTWRLDRDLLGVGRSLEPAGALPHIASRLDATSGPTAWEIALDVELLAVDATSFAALRERAGADPERMGELIKSIVAERGKLQNPWTGSGGVVMGRVAQVGKRHVTPELKPGELVVPLASLIAIPLALESVGPVDPASPQVPARGRAIVTGRMLCAAVPPDVDARIALAVLDVYPAASHARTLAEPGQHVLVLGSGHAGLLAMAAARESVGPDGQVTAVDRSPQALAQAVAIDPAAAAVNADVTDPLAVARALAARGLGPADLTLLCASAAGSEGTAILATGTQGTVVFFSTATRFAAAALGADAIGSRPQLLIPHGLTDDRGDYAFALLRSNPPLLGAFETATNRIRG